MRTLLALSTLPREGPSVRPRVLAYEEALAAAGIRLRFRPFLPPAGFRGFYSTSLLARARKAAFGVAGYLRRLADLLLAEQADGVLVHREIVPRGSARALVLFRERGLRVAYDLDDAIYLSPRDFVVRGDTSRRRMSRLKDPGEVDAMIGAAHLVLAGNETIAHHARRRAADVRILPTPVDTDLYRPRPKGLRKRPLVGWVGSPTATYCLKEIAPALARAAREVPFDLLVVGAGEKIAIEGVRVVNRRWSLTSEPYDFAALDVGLYPLPDNEWTRGKCGMKALEYLACEVPAVVSPVGVNREIVTEGETGLFAATDEEWTERLLEYLRDPDLRAAHGRAGRAAVEAGWSLRALTPRFVGAMRELTA